MIKRWLVFDIGCIECGEDSGVVGTYATEDEAKAVANSSQLSQEQNWTGQHYVKVYDLGEPFTGDGSSLFEQMGGTITNPETHPEWKACKQ